MTDTKLKSKSQLAKLLAIENITFQHNPSAKTASFDVKSRLLTLPVWQNISEDLYDMLVVHEVGHALDTPADGWLEAIESIAKNVYEKPSERAKNSIRGFLNVIEDARIDKRQKRRYPGSRRNYVVGYKELISRDFFGTATRDINNLSFIDRANIYFKGGVLLGIQFSAVEKKLLNKIAEAETFEDVVIVTEEVFKFSKVQNDMNQTISSGDIDMNEFEDEDEDSDDYVWGDDDDEDEHEGDENVRQGDLSSKNSDPKKEDDSDESENEDDDTQGKRGDRGNGDIDENSKTGGSRQSDGAGNSSMFDDDNVPESETERAWQQNVANITMNTEKNFIYLDVPKPIIDNFVDDYKVFISQNMSKVSPETYKVCYEEMSRFKTEENNTISFMVKEFEMRKSAENYAKTSIAKTGVIDTNKLHSYKYNDDIFRRLATVPNGKNHGFVMILDWSGSMHPNIRKTVKQLMSLVLFCKRVQIPFEVYTFRELEHFENTMVVDKTSWGTTIMGVKCFEKQNNTINFHSFRMRNVLSSRMNTAELNQAMTLLWMARFRLPVDGMGGTPLNQAIVATEELIYRFRKKNRVQIVNTIFLTDGDSNPVEGAYYDKTMYPFKRLGNEYILRDNVSKKEYKLGSNILACYHQLTTVLLNVLKDRTGCNLIGFFLSNDSPRYVANRFFDKTEDAYKKVFNSMKENKFVAISDAGYDEYYIINVRDMNITNEKLEVTPEMSKNQVAKSFLKFSEKKSVNRVMLKRFVERIANPPKKRA